MRGIVQQLSKLLLLLTIEHGAMVLRLPTIGVWRQLKLILWLWKCRSRSYRLLIPQNTNPCPRLRLIHRKEPCETCSSSHLRDMLVFRMENVRGRIFCLLTNDGAVAILAMGKRRKTHSHLRGSVLEKR